VIDTETRFLGHDGLEGVYKMAAFGNTALKSLLKCSFTQCKFRFFERFLLASPSFAYFANTLLLPKSFNAVQLQVEVKVQPQVQLPARLHAVVTPMTRLNKWPHLLPYIPVRSTS
jgi:hypothetical protein